jgi:hypothetical protein
MITLRERIEKGLSIAGAAVGSGLTPKAARVEQFHL